MPKGIYTRTESHNRKIGLAHIGKMMGSENPNWKGDDVGYQSLHDWVERSLGKTKLCENCKRTDRKKYEWANKSGEYERDLKDWIRLCTSCHRKYDSSLIKK